jgi:hypothetical protein
MLRSDAIARRQLLKAGLVIAGTPFCPEALFDRRAVADDEKADGPIGPREIVRGLDGMSRVAEKGGVFGLGHNAAAVISAAFFCREQRLDVGMQTEILAYLDARLLKSPIYETPRPKESADPKLVEGLLEDLDAGIAALRGKGHNIIFAIAALKALGAVPEAATPARVGGLRKMVQSFGRTGAGKAPKDEKSDGFVDLADEGKFIHFIFEEFLRAKGDGFDGHVVTIGHALVELYRMGHKGLARKGVPAYWQWVRQSRADRVEAAAPREGPTPLAREYWAAQAKRRVGEIVSSHMVKYPYSFYALARDVKDEDLKKRILAKVSRLTAVN